MQFQHIGCAVDSIEDYLRIYQDALGFSRISEIIPVRSQDVQVCFVEIGPNSYMELIEPLSKKSPIEKFQRQGYYHVCYQVEDIEQTIESLKAQGFFFISLFTSEAFGGHRCSFMMNPLGHLIEFAEAPPKF